MVSKTFKVSLQRRVRSLKTACTRKVEYIPKGRQVFNLLGVNLIMS